MDPYFYLDLSERMGKRSVVSEAARSINESMPMSSSKEISNILQSKEIDEPRIMILGYSYKPETGDTRDTPVYLMSQALLSKKSKLFVWDPFVSGKDLPEWVEKLDGPFDKSMIDIVILATAHRQIIDMDWSKLKDFCTTPRIYDGRRALSPKSMQESGWEYYGVGYPASMSNFFNN